jgi:hypothetical protein
MAYRAAAYGHSNAGLDERSFPRSAACVAGHDAPRIGERAAARGATEGGDEHAGMTTIALATFETITPAANDATRDAHADR